MKLKPLTPEDAERTKWHIEAYGMCWRLDAGMVTAEQIRNEVERCPAEHRDYFRDWLNRYRQSFKERRAWINQRGAGTSTGSSRCGKYSATVNDWR